METKLTVKKALQETAKMWSRLAKNGNPGKPYEAYEKYRCGCACCEYVTQQTHADRAHGMFCADPFGSDHKRGVPDLKLCPMRSAWPKGCEHSSSPYVKWDEADDEEARKVYAKKIADAAKRLLAKLFAKEQKSKASK